VVRGLHAFWQGEKTRRAPNGKELIATLITIVRSLVGKHVFWTQTTERTPEFKGPVRQVNLGREGAQDLQVKGGSNVSETIHELIEQTHARYEVLPYYIVQEEPHGTTKRIQAGFDIEVYGIKPSHVRHPGRDYVFGCVALEKLVETVLPHTGESCSIEVISFPSTLVFDTKRQFQEEGMLRIRITHKGLQPAGQPEERALKEIKERLHDLGLSQR
jgi:hypothetical protein